jgi:2-iminobutanoate/2-iminopropanoate deaminase
MEKRFVNPETVAPPVGSYSHAVTLDVGEATLIFVSGQIALDRAGRLVGEGDMARQAEQVFENLKAILEAAGSSFDQVLSTTIYITDFADFGGVNEVYGRYVGAQPPARATVQIAGLPMGAKVEIAVVAHV